MLDELLRDIAAYTPTHHPTQAAFRRRLLRLTKGQMPSASLAERHDAAADIFSVLLLQFSLGDTDVGYAATRHQLGIAVRRLVLTVTTPTTDSPASHP